MTEPTTSEPHGVPGWDPVNPTTEAPSGAAGAGDQGVSEPFRTPEALLAEKDQEIAVLRDRHLRLQAEFENYKKRQIRERSDLLKFANEALLREFLPVLDNLERAVSSAADEASPAALRAGLEIIVRLLRSTLEKAGVTRIECQNAPFDPTIMQAVQQVASPDGAEGKVVDVVQQGYLLEGRVLRPAMVKVSRAAAPAETPAPSADA